MHTDLSKILAHRPCANGWKRLLRGLGKTGADKDPLPIKTILQTNGLDDALWCLRAVRGYDRELRLLAVEYASYVREMMVDARSIAALEVAVRYADGQVSEEERASIMRAATRALEKASGYDRSNAAHAAVYTLCRRPHEAVYLAAVSATEAVTHNPCLGDYDERQRAVEQFQETHLVTLCQEVPV